MRIVITGPPRSGKTKIAGLLAEILKPTNLRHTDDVRDKEWSEGSAIVAKWFDEPGPWIIEGVVVPRALRKWRNYNDEEELPPFDKIIVLRWPFDTPTSGQHTLGKQVIGLIDTMKDWAGDRWVEL